MSSRARRGGSNSLLCLPMSDDSDRQRVGRRRNHSPGMELRAPKGKAGKGEEAKRVGGGREGESKVVSSSLASFLSYRHQRILTGSEQRETSSTSAVNRTKSLPDLFFGADLAPN